MAKCQRCATELQKQKHQLQLGADLKLVGALHELGGPPGALPRIKP